MIPSEPIDSSPLRAEPAADASNHAAAPGGDPLRQFVARAGDLSQRGVQRWRDDASAHVRAHPMRSVAIAASTGVLLALLLRAMNR
jgi:ElaB/YqjD/DUF883 family membrane-anchored ribosome-binding protein